jgi:hypothetical protein
MTATPTHVCRIGFNWNSKDGKTTLRFEPGDAVAGIPVKVRERLAADGVIDAAAPAVVDEPKDAA